MEQTAILVDQNNIVVNVIVAPVGPYTPWAGTTAILADGNIGDTWDGTKCVPPAPPADQPT